MLMKTKESLSVEALRALVNSKDFYEYHKELIIDSMKSFWDKMPPESIEGRKIIFYLDKNSESLKSNYEEVFEILELEPPQIDGDELIMKINHILCVNIATPLDENSWPKRLTNIDKDIIRNSLDHAEKMGRNKEVKSFSLASCNKWTYAKFIFDNDQRRFKIVGVAMKSFPASLKSG